MGLSCKKNIGKDAAIFNYLDRKGTALAKKQMAERMAKEQAAAKKTSGKKPGKKKTEAKESA